jgi:rSAM/selenodomain-associated transferase 2
MATANFREPGQWSVVIPVLNEVELLGGLLAQLPDVAELIVVDGGSSDGSCELALLMGAKLLRCSCANRGAQLAHGAGQARGSHLFFVHADARLPAGWCGLLAACLEQPGVSAAAFRLRVQAAGWRLRLLEFFVHLRSSWRELPYGDQGLAITKQTYGLVGGFQPIPLMEDLDLVQRLKKLGSVVIAPAAITVSGRRWQRLGVWRSCWRNAKLRAAWRRGVSAEILAERY